MDDRTVIEKGRRSHQIIESDEWREAWDAYRAALMREIESCGSRDTETVMHCKRLLAAAVGARMHLERLITDGQVAEKSLELLNKTQQAKKKVRAWL
jgi:hypothetical protein